MSRHGVCDSTSVKTAKYLRGLFGGPQSPERTPEGSKRPPGPKIGKPVPGKAGDAPHRFEGFPGPPGPARPPQNPARLLSGVPTPCLYDPSLTCLQ